MVEPEVKLRENIICEIDVIFKNCEISQEIEKCNIKKMILEESASNPIKYIYLQYYNVNVKLYDNINRIINIIMNKFKNTILILSFKKCTFNTEIKLEKINCNIAIIYYRCQFNENISLFGSKFNKQINFIRCIFNKNSNFKNTYFSHVRFSGSTFNGEALFEEASFDRSNFSRVTFHGFIDLTATIIDKSKTSFMGCPTNQTINDVKKLTKKICKIGYLRESYCIIKSILISEHNILEASNWHKLELYAKEVELETKKPKSFTRDWIDKWQLIFYRITSDHHTDLLKITNWTIACIGYFFLLWQIIFRTSGLEMVLLLLFVTCLYCLHKSTRLITGYISTAYTMAVCPKFIFGIANIFSSEQNLEWYQYLGMSAYSLIAFLLIFSLQKTARRNSIIPN